MSSLRPRFILSCSVASLIVAAASSAHAQSTNDNWTGTTSNDWNDASNWDLGTVPTGANNAVVNTATGNIATVTAVEPGVGDVDDGNVAGAAGRIDVTAGSFGNAGSGWTYVGVEGSTGTLNIANTAATGGTFTGYGQGSGSYNVGYQLHVGGQQDTAGGTGTLNVNTTGTVTVGNDIYIGGNSHGTGTFNMDSGTFTQTAGWAFVGGDMDGDGTGGNGTLNQSGGTLTFADQLHVGRATNSNSSINLTGGTLNVGNYIIGENGGTGTGTQGGTSVVNESGQFWIGNASLMNNVYTLNGGSFTNNDWVAIGRNGGVGTLNINGGSFTKNAGSNGFFDISGDGGTGTAGTVNLNGGTLTVDKIITENGTSTFNFNGGTLVASSDGTQTVNGDTNTSFMQGLTTANVRTGGAIINTGGFNLTINQALVHSTIAGDAATDGGLTKAGTGVLTLTAANTYTGTTTISAGGLTIAANGGLGTGNVFVGAGTTLTLSTGVTAAHNGTTGTTLTLASATTSLVNLAGAALTVQDTVTSLVVNGVVEPAGTYGAAGSGALFTNIADFTGTGELLVLTGTAVPEPSTWAMGVFGLGMASVWLRRRRVA